MSRTAPRISPPPPPRGKPNTTAAHLHAQPEPQPRTTGLHQLPNAFAARAAHREQQRIKGVLHHRSAQPYTCPELRRLEGIGNARYAAYALPSRMGDRLHYPDGRVTDMQGQPLPSLPSPSTNPKGIL